ncbi:MAG: 5-formyltetrahydrofolate cyclo-ligase [Cyanobium sp.]
MAAPPVGGDSGPLPWPPPAPRSPTEDTVADHKAGLRRHFRALRRASLPVLQPALAAMARACIPALLPPQLRLGLYWPLRDEPDLNPLAAGGLGEVLEGRLALPAVPAGHGGLPDGRLLYLPWDGTPPAGRDACGIPAPLPVDGRPPAPLAPGSLGLLLVPALAIDRRGIRLGSGGGWYDRLRADPVWRAVPALAVLSSACVTDVLPADPWDVPFDGWLDEHGVHPITGAADA